MKIRPLIKYIGILIGICVWRNGHTQISPIPIRQLDSLMVHQPKPILLFLTADWCSYCAMQQKILRRNKRFISNSDKFYFVEFNASQRNPIKFQGKEYHYRPHGVNTGFHEFTTLFVDGNKQLTYPSWLMLTPAYSPVFKQNGLLNKHQLDELLSIFQKSRYNM